MIRFTPPLPIPRSSTQPQAHTALSIAYQRSRLLVWLTLTGALAPFTRPLAGQYAPPSVADSMELLEDAKDVQARYERYREQRTPPALADLSRRCDDIVGRFCSRFPDHMDADEWRAPEELPELELARTRVLKDLGEIAQEIPGDLWIMGQRVYYLIDKGALASAAGLARRCGGRAHWWCTALAAYVHHARGAWTTADEVFAQALAEMPADTAARWRAPGHLLEESALDMYEKAVDKESVERNLWLLADPLYLVEGNDRKTEQYARQVLVRMRAEAINGTGLDWDEDLEEVTLRWGPPEAWSRERELPTGDSLVDSRRMVSHRRGQEFLPPAKVLEDPSEVAPAEWVLGERARMELRQKSALVDPINSGSMLERATQNSDLFGDSADLTAIFRDGIIRSGPRTGYTAPYAKDFGLLETQVARFRRGDSLLVAAAFARKAAEKLDPGAPPPVAPRKEDGVDLRAARNESRSDKQKRTNPFGEVREVPVPFIAKASEERIQSGLFLIDSESGQPFEVRGEGAGGTFQLRAPNRHYVVGLEAFSPDEQKAWRDRHGLWQDPLVPGLAAISDLLILEGGGGLPTSLDEALPTALPAVRIESGDGFKVAWELYGLRVGESASVRIGVNRGRSSIVTRLGEFLRVVEPNEPVVMTWEEAGPDVLGTVFRAVELNLPDLEPGDYTLTVEIELSGREPMMVARPISIVPGSE